MTPARSAASIDSSNARLLELVTSVPFVGSGANWRASTVIGVETGVHDAGEVDYVHLAFLSA